VKHIFVGALCAALLASAWAGETPGTPAQTRSAAELRAKPAGYAFGQPELLIRQRLFGLAHGLSLLAAACLDLPEHSGPIENAYAAWHARQGKTIETVAHDLSIHYFGPRAGEANWQDLARALNLNESIQPALREVSLEDACATLPAAIVRPRYEFDKLLAEVDSRGELARETSAHRRQAGSYDSQTE